MRSDTIAALFAAAKSSTSISTRRFSSGTAHRDFASAARSAGTSRLSGVGAEICHSQGDAKGAIKFTQLGEKLQRRLRDQKLRKRRLWAERRRASYNPYELCA